MVEAHQEARRDISPDDLSRDGWLGGRLTLVQPKRGHRVGSDAALLAAAVDLAEGRVTDVGAGVGAVGLALLHRNQRLTADLVEIDAFLARLATDNAALNGLESRVRVMHLDIGAARARREAGLADESADAVVTNPPFFEARAVNVSPNEHKAHAHVLRARNPGVATLADWIRASIAILKPGGRFAMIHRPEALTAILAAAENRIGAVALLPVHPRAGASAHRLLISGVKGSHGPLRIAPALILHEPDGRLTKEADTVHRGERLIDWGV